MIDKMAGGVTGKTTQGRGEKINRPPQLLITDPGTFHNRSQSKAEMTLIPLVVLETIFRNTLIGNYPSWFVMATFLPDYIPKSLTCGFIIR